LTQDFRLEWQIQLDDLVTVIVPSPDGDHWAASSAAGSVIWFDRLHQVISLQPPNGKSIAALAFSADGRWLAAGGLDGKLVVWDCTTTDRPPVIANTLEINAWIEHLTWHPTSSRLAIGSGADVQIWDPLGARIVTTWELRSLAAARHRPAALSTRAAIFDLAWQQTHGENLAVAGSKGVQIWTPAQGADPSYRLDIDTASIKIARSPDDRYLAVGNLDRSLTIIDLDRPQDPWVLQGCPGKIRDLTWIKNQCPCLAVATGTAVVLWELTQDDSNWTGQLLEGHQGIVMAISAHPQYPLFVSGAADGCACLWSATGEIEQILTEGISGFTAMGWDAQGTYLATGSQMGEIGLWRRSA
jgi:WD40 repeat protein